MNLFEDEYINISKIHTVNMYESKKLFAKTNVRRYSANLPTYELVFFVSGEGVVKFGSELLNDEPDSVRYLPKGNTDGEYTVTKSVPGTCIDIFFDTPDKMPYIAMSLKNMGELKPLFVKIYNVWNQKKTGYYAESMSILYEIIRKIKKHTEKYSTSEQKRKLIPSYNYMLENFCNSDFDYKEMCRQSGLSYDYFKELFIKQYGTTPVKYLTNLRIEKAKELLITGHYSITEIAGMCGFENVYYFSNVFKKQVGISPKNYKNNPGI